MGRGQTQKKKDEEKGKGKPAPTEEEEQAFGGDYQNPEPPPPAKKRAPPKKKQATTDEPEKPLAGADQNRIEKALNFFADHNVTASQLLAFCKGRPSHSLTQKDQQRLEWLAILVSFFEEQGIPPASLPAMVEADGFGALDEAKLDDLRALRKSLMAGDAAATKKMEDAMPKPKEDASEEV